MKYRQFSGWLRIMLAAEIVGYGIGIAVEHIVTAVYAQDESKVVKLAYSHNPQIKFSELKSGEIERKFGESFAEDEEWLKRLAFKAENISGKSIIYRKINVNFPETRPSGSMASYPVSFGQRPGFFIPNIEPLEFKQGDVLNIDLSGEYEKISKFINYRHQIGLMKKIDLEIGFIIFEDGTAWTAGTFYRPDPDNPRRYLPID